MKSNPLERVLLIVLDSVGVGESPDAARFGDQGASTLSNIAKAVGGLHLPNLGRLGLGHITPVNGVPPEENPIGAFGKMQERSEGKDTTTGHWEMMGLWVKKPFRTFPNGFPEEILQEFREKTGRGVLGNKAASGTEIIKELGKKQKETGDWIVYTSADSVFQIAAHEEVIPLEELYKASQIAREILDNYQVGRVIARPFIGEDGKYTRTYNRKDFSIKPEETMVLNVLEEAKVPVVGIGKIEDIYAGQGISRSVHTEGNQDAVEKIYQELLKTKEGVLFANLVDFDMLYGHRNDPKGYAKALENFDKELPRLLGVLSEKDILLLTADHGNDPTTPSTDHSREYVPLLAYGPSLKQNVPLGIRDSFADIGATIADIFNVSWKGMGNSFLSELLAS